MLKKIGSLLCAGILMCGMVSAASAELKVGMVFDVGGKGDNRLTIPPIAAWCGRRIPWGLSMWKSSRARTLTAKPACG